MVDGSFKRKSSNLVYVFAGIGDYIRDKSGNKIYTFLGPVDVKEVVESEMMAMKFIINVLQATHFRGYRI